MEGVALRELIDEQKEAMRLDVRGEETFEFVVVVLDAFREVLSSPLSHLSLCFSVAQLLDTQKNGTISSQFPFQSSILRFLRFQMPGQGDTSGCSQGSVDIKTEVPF